MKNKILVRGLPTSPGQVSGKVRVILSRSCISEFEDGEILVASGTPPEWVETMRRAKAIITDTGGITSHASIVSRELGIPCIVGTGGSDTAGTLILRTGMEITVDATHGIVYEGVIAAGEMVKTPNI
jgi:pyruvate, water dikinase